MKICFISTEYGGHGGIGISTKRIVDSLIKKGLEVEVVIPDIVIPYVFNEKSYMKSKANIHKVGPSLGTLSYYSPQETQNFIYYIGLLHKKYNFDIFHGFRFTPSGFLAVYLAKFYGKKSIVSIRGNDIARNIFDTTLFSTIKWTIENANLITSNASDLISVANIFSPCKNKSKLIYNSINLNEFYYSKDIDLNLKGVVVGTIGLIRKKKGFLWILDAFKKLLKTKNATFLLIGDFISNEREFYLEKIKQLGLKDKIIITGIVDHKLILNYIMKLDVYIIASITEGCPNALLEAMFCKKPVITSNVGGMADIIRHKKNGYIIQPRSYEEIYTALIEILENNQLKNKISLNGYETVKHELTYENEINGWIDAYKGLMK